MDPVPTLSRTPIPDASLGDPRNFVNRELSTLAFLERILEDASFQREVLPVLTPLALDPAHPFPHLRNESLNVAIRFAGKPGARLRYGVVPVPSLLPRLVNLPDGAVPLEDIIARHVAQLFPEMPV